MRVSLEKPPVSQLPRKTWRQPGCIAMICVSNSWGRDAEVFAGEATKNSGAPPQRRQYYADLMKRFNILI